MPERASGESEQAYLRRLSAWLVGDDVRSKDDLKEWAGSPPFHINRE